MRRLLRLNRNVTKLTQKQVADAVGITMRMYQYIESGHRNPSWSVAKRLEQFFGIPASELLTEINEPTGTD